MNRRRFVFDGFRLLALAPALHSASLLALAGLVPRTRSAIQVADDALLEEIERAAFLFFWEQAHPATGFVKDRASVTGKDKYRMASVAATGFGLTALAMGDTRDYRQHQEIAARVRLTLESLLNKGAAHEGYFYHFLDWQTGKRYARCELSSIDTALLMCGVLTARAHFRDDTAIVRAATTLYERVNWPWMLNGGTTLSMGWHPGTGFIESRWSYYCELMMLYLLGMGSPTHPLPAASWQAWTRPTMTYDGITYISSKDPLFVHQYSQAYFDFRSKRDAYADYFENSAKATEAHRRFCLSLKDRYPDYAPNLWGVTASDSLNGYQAWGGPPEIGTWDGSVVPCAAGGSLPFAPTECLAVLRNIRQSYPAAWGRYGFTDAFNPFKKWYNPDVLGIDQGITMLMAENLRTGRVWETFMTNVEMQAAMQHAGFVSTEKMDSAARTS
ncbi:MAG: glucoamylase family protein [Acidobacteriota bacterium]|nr:glucoamylase family protein [Acidobacteriota bacterium]